MKYDLNDLGFLYKGPASIKTKTIDLGQFKIIDVPADCDDESVCQFVIDWAKEICAVEIPTSLLCNLDCEYCYIYDKRLKNKKVSPDIIERIVIETIKMFNLSDRNEVYFTPWGAEPFLEMENWDIMLETASKLIPLQNLFSSTSTNGTIWNSKIENILEKWIRKGVLKDIQISLDGPEWVQNRFRPYKNGKGSFKDVENFTKNYIEFCDSLGVKPNFHFCSTIYISDEKFLEAWKDSVLFFSEPNTWHFSPFLPSRISWKNLTEEEVEKFVEAQRITFEISKMRVENNIPCLDFFTSKLFFEISNKCKNCFPYCSALNSQIGVDLDGSIYPCHGPITSPLEKAFFWFGNVFEKTISFIGLIRNLSWMYNLWTRAKCTKCKIFNESTGNICWSCPPLNIDITFEPSFDDYKKCIAFNRSFEYWKKIAYMNIEGNPFIKKYNLPKLEKPFKVKDQICLSCNSIFSSAVKKMGFFIENVKLTDSWITMWRNSFESILKDKLLVNIDEFFNIINLDT